MEKWVKEALGNYSLVHPQLEFIRHNENMTYQVVDEGKKYVLRIKKPVEGFTGVIFGDEFSAYELMESEMKLLQDLSMHSDLKLQAPLKNKKGELVSLLIDGSPCCILEWVEGTVLNEKEVTDDQARMLGKMVAQLHKGFEKCHGAYKRITYSSKRIIPMVEQVDEGTLNGHFTSEEAALMKAALEMIGTRMDELERIPGMSGIIHADLGLSNILQSEGGFTPIDFSLSGYGYYFMDTAMMMTGFKDQNMRRSIKEGYENERGIEVPETYLDAFFALSVLLYITCQHHKIWQEEWFPKAMTRWCQTIFSPLVGGEGYVLSTKNG